MPIFISYSSKDQKTAEAICDAIENRGHPCWISSRDIGPGENFQTQIVRAIRHAKIMVLVFSGNANNSEEIKKELVLAGQSRLVVIPVRVEDVTPDEAFAYEFATRQWIDVFGDWEHAIQRVVHQIESVIGDDETEGIQNTEEAASPHPRAAAPPPPPAAAEPVAAVTVPAAAAPKRGSPMGAVLGIAAVVVVIVGGFLAWKLLSPQSSGPTATAPVETIGRVAGNVGQSQQTGAGASSPSAENTPSSPRIAIPPALTHPEGPSGTAGTSAPTASASSQQPATPLAATTPQSAPAPPTSAPQPAPAPPPTVAARTTPKTFRDCPQCPEMVVIPAGNFRMGAAPGENQRYEVSATEAERTEPQHQVTFAKPFALAKFDVTRGEFMAFATATGFRPRAGCQTVIGNNWMPQPRANWEEPGYPQTDRDPVVCMNDAEISAYLGWLHQKTGKDYRLPSESEWEYAERGGTTTAFYWGDDPKDACAYENVGDRDYAAKYGVSNPIPCKDGYADLAPVGSFKPNPFGLYDMAGNIFVILADCWNETYAGASTDGSPWTSGDCMRHVVRKAAFGNPHPAMFRSANREAEGMLVRRNRFGFRVALSLPQ